MQPPSPNTLSSAARQLEHYGVKEVLISLFKWNNQANEEFLVALERSKDTPTKCSEILAHVINVHELWINRITNIKDAELLPWNRLGKVDLGLKNSNNFYATLGLLSSEGYGDNFKWKFEYVNHASMNVVCTLADAYFHILAHSSYHRGQISYILREHKIKAPETSLIMLNQQH